MGIPLFGVLGIYLDQVHARAINSGCDMSELKSFFDPQGINRHDITSVKHIRRIFHFVATIHVNVLSWFEITFIEDTLED